MSFTVGLATTAFIDALGARPGLKGVRITPGVPKPPLPPEPANLYLLGHLNLVRSTRERVLIEAYDLRILVEVHGLADQAAVASRLESIWDEIDAAVGSDPGLPGPFDATATFRSSESGWVGDTWLARGQGFVSVRAAVSDG